LDSAARGAKPIQVLPNGSAEWAGGRWHQAKKSKPSQTEQPNNRNAEPLIYRRRPGRERGLEPAISGVTGQEFICKIDDELTLLGAEAGCAAKVSTENLSRLPIRINRFAE
jgi:hypothetical protein